VANQTTMLSGESLAIAAEVGRSLERRFGGETGWDPAAHFRSFDTICSATQERQDAVAKLLATDPPLDLMLVIGGYNSSNTNHLAVLGAERTLTFHVSDADRLDPEAGSVRFKPNGSAFDTPEVEASDWIPPGPVTIGLTAGASTPNNKIGEAIERILQTRGIPAVREVPAEV
jgi:4-hydroxy-3-methylbut-2-enyl diphosphate reductase